MNLHDTVDCQYLDSELKEYALCDFLTQESAEKVKTFVQTQQDYHMTPLVSLESLARRFGVKKIYVKDESKRMGMNAFKVVGVLYSVARLICEKFALDISEITFDDLMKEELNSEIRKLVLLPQQMETTEKGWLGWPISWGVSVLSMYRRIRQTPELRLLSSLVPV